MTERWRETVTERDREKERVSENEGDRKRACIII